MTPNYYTPHNLAAEFGVTPATARRALRVVAPQSGTPHEVNQWWRFDLADERDRLTVDAARARLKNGGRHSIRGDRHYARKAREIAATGRKPSRGPTIAQR